MAFSRAWLSSVAILALLSLVAVGQAQLSTTFYSKSCPAALSIVSKQVNSIFAANPNLAGGLQRLHFHDCFVRGCDASVLLVSSSSTNQEIDAPPNKNSLRGFQQIDQVKSALEAACPGVVSCADILAIVARDATVKAGGPTWPVLLGRRDGTVSLASEALAALPSPSMNLGQLIQNFAAVGLNASDMIVLSGAHTFGRAHCGPILNRLYNFNGVHGQIDASMDSSLAANLKKQCPPNDVTTIITMDSSPNVFDRTYFKQVIARGGLFTSDAVLATDSRTLAQATRLAQPGSSFFEDFAAAMVKMSKIHVLTGSQGEIRKKCSVKN
ncbi:peroxidase [Marchantia polymorpha subsp. ruderalis]|uniref:Peroxidase n=2 Tax=Marchantia polymorpha TaxID=3197 RepID=A0AAF6B3P6_MARPO|nr:hypothetical protein MARPO_0024s0047 [Marchantia polymorpha]BBN06630.1 hypothetical protein Mp_3g22700 [Marchantia polymorpha subsp. ruderalis]|eukprot:PTQ43529.1 hypothetical protein MARPO_0024s0047 [Marchantia polymorpha]